ncbi:hypothetical protein P7C73_g4177, partial [Tremellales sp. Uapishka_1]
MTIAPIPKWDRPEPTKCKLDYADLTNIDLSLFDTEEGKLGLVETIRHALTDVGFWIVTNSGFSEAEIEQQFALGQAFYNLSLEERNTNRCDVENGGYWGYRADNMELLNIPKYIPEYKDVPRHQFVKNHEEVIADFHRHCWYNVARKLFVLFALAMELPENYFVERHDYERPSQDHLRYQMMYHPRTPEEDAQCDNLWSWAHTDYGSLTLLFSQTVSGLQVKMPDGVYKDIKPVPGSIVVNVADTLSFMTKGYLKSTIHRVTVPATDQRHIHRVGVIFGTRPNDDCPVVVAPSPLLQRLGVLEPGDCDITEDTPTAGEYVAARVKAVHAKAAYGHKAGEVFKYKNLTVLENYADVPETAPVAEISAA